MQYSDLTQAMTIVAQQHDAFGVYTFIKNPDFTNYLPRIIEYAENRIFREIVPLASRAQSSSSSAVFTAGKRTVALNLFPVTIKVFEGIAAITPSSSASPSAGIRWQYEKTSLDFIDYIWPQESITRAPQTAYPELYWAPLDASNIVVAPTPDQAYPIEGTGIFLPAPISAANPSTYLSTVYPDLLVAACMIHVAAFMRDYGSAADDPKLALTWEADYTTLKQSVMEEEQRRRGQGMDGTSLPPAPEMGQPRGVAGSGGGPARGARVPF